MERKWWKEAVGYQIYPRSFNDTNGDGIGDLRGIIEKLDYLEDLGIDLIWICPFYKSPMDDNGYDVSDYYDIDPMFGSMDDCKELIEKAHNKGIRIIADLVLNHTSDEHPWFIEAKSSLDNKYRDFYIWKQGKEVEGKEVEPTNWASFFGGSAWRKDENTDEYFMKIFSDKMPDLNWENSELRNEMYKMANWWLDLGIDGFRVDAVAHIARDNTFTDSKLDLYNGYAPDWGKFSNLPDVHKFLKEFNKEVLSGKDVMTVGEVGGDATPLQALDYVGENEDEFNMVFNFDHNHALDFRSGDTNKIDLDRLKVVFEKWQTGLYGKGWNAIYWLNHDQPRVLSHYGDTSEEYRVVSAKMLATAMYFMWGTPFLYNGEEIGMTNYPFTKLEEFTDVAIHNNYKYAKANGLSIEDYIASNANTSRDNSRTPFQWSDQDYAGFSTAETWMKVNPNYKTINAASQINDPNSIFSYYKEVIKLRKDSKYKDLICYGNYKLELKKLDDIYTYSRDLDDQKLLVVTNFSSKTIEIDFDFEVKEIILSNYSTVDLENNKLILKAYEGIVFEIEK